VVLAWHSQQGVIQDSHKEHDCKAKGTGQKNLTTKTKETYGIRTTKRNRKRNQDQQPQPFQKLIEEQQEDDRYLPLETACQYNRLEMAKILIEKGAYIHDGFNSLAYAAEHGNIEFIKYLYEHAQHIGDPYNGPSISQALDSVAGAGHVKAMEFILSLYDRSKVTPGYDPIDGEAVERAIESKHLDMLKALVMNGANLRSGNDIAFKQARAMKRHRKPCKKLLSILSYLETSKKIGRSTRLSLTTSKRQ